MKNPGVIIREIKPDELASLEPTPYELATLAAQLITAGVIKNSQGPAECLRIAAGWWAEARVRQSHLEKAELYRRIAVKKKMDRDQRGDLSEGEVIGLVGGLGLDYFRELAAEFYALDWAAVAREPRFQESQYLRHLGSLAVERSALALVAGFDACGRAPPSVTLPRQWRRTVANAFVDWRRIKNSTAKASNAEKRHAMGRQRARNLQTKTKSLQVRKGALKKSAEAIRKFAS